MTKWHPEHRAVAQQVMTEANGQIRKATKLFNARVPRHDIQHLSEYIKYWWKREDVETKKSTGRPYSLPQSDSKRLANKWKKGYMVKGQRVGYQSINHACKSNQDFKQSMQAAHIKQTKTLMRNMAHVDPGVKKVQQIPKTTIAPTNKQKRMKFCRKHARLPLSFYRSITWSDETTFEVKMPKMAVSADRTGKRLVVEDPYNLKDQKKKIYLRAALAINCAKGPLVLWWHTGTTGVTYDPPFQVNAALFKFSH